MNPQTRYLTAGIFLLLGATLLVVLILWFGQRRESEPTASYAIEIPSGVSGLSDGSAVRYLGVDVGTVQSIRLQTTQPPFVQVVIEIRASVPVDGATYATLVDQGVTGISNVSLAHDVNQRSVLERAPDGFLIVPFRATGLAAILADSGDISAGLKQLITQLNSLTDVQNRDRIALILTDLNELSMDLAEYKNEIPKILADLKSMIATIEHTANNVNQTVRDDLPPITSDLKVTSARLVAISTRVDAWLTDNEAAIENLLSAGASNIPRLVDDLRDTSVELKHLSESLREDPSQIVYRPQRDAVEVDP